MIKTEIITERAKLDGLADTWETLTGPGRGASIFQTWEWQESWWRHLAGGARPFLLLVKDGDDPVGMAPLACRRVAGSPLRRLEFSGCGISDYLDFLSPDTSRKEFWEQICQGLQQARGSWDLLDLHQIPDGSPTLSEFPEACRSLGWQVEVYPQEVCPGLALPSGWPELLASFGKKSRFRINYYRRLAERELGACWQLAGGEHEVAPAMEHLFHLHGARWRRRGLPGMLHGDRKRQFHQEVADRFHRKGWLRLQLASHDDHVVAASYCFAFQNVVYYYLSGFHPGYARYSLGTVLVGLAIEKAIEEGRERFDFLRGRESYKYQWGASDRTNWGLRVIPSGLGARVAVTAARLSQRLERQAKSALHHWLGRKAKGKKG